LGKAEKLKTEKLKLEKRSERMAGEMGLPSLD
jgi:hypothetical protein